MIWEIEIWQIKAHNKTLTVKNNGEDSISVLSETCSNTHTSATGNKVSENEKSCVFIM